jgi:hypothetical protein
MDLLLYLHLVLQVGDLVLQRQHLLLILVQVAGGLTGTGYLRGSGWLLAFVGQLAV